MIASVLNARGAKKANAQFIVQACNAHDDLVKALEIMLQVFNVKTIDPMKAFIAIEKARSEITKATGEQS
jgi:hypothetical protein